jgi:tetratricopeptide (TPR) repeat protein
MKIVLTLVCIGSFSLELVGMNTSVENASLEKLDESALLVLSEKGNPIADYYLARLYYDKNETAKAREFFRKAAPDIAAAYYMLGTLAEEEGDIAAAEKMYGLAAQKRVKEAEYEMGNICLKHGDIKKAREFYERSGAQDVLDALHNAATLCEEEGDYVKAAEYYAAAKSTTAN